MPKQIFTIIIIISAFVLIISVLLQQKGGGLGGAFGGTESGSYMKKRGAEKIVFYLTIISAIVFAGSILLSLVLK